MPLDKSISHFHLKDFLSKGSARDRLTDCAPPVSPPIESASLKNIVPAGRTLQSVVVEALSEKCHQLKQEKRILEVKRLPVPANFDPNDFSRKVFVGRLPHYVTPGSEFGMALDHIFRRFGNLEIQWPRPAQFPSARPLAPRLTGYLFLLFNEQKGIRQLIQRCYMDLEGEYFLDLGMALESVRVHIRLWRRTDAIFFNNPGVMINPSMNTVFMGRLPRMITATEIALHLQARFQTTIVYVQIDIDDVTNYPQGCAAVVFATHEGYLAALAAQMIDFSAFAGRTWLTEMKPFVCFGGMCDDCEKQKPVEFCKDIKCLQYYCQQCWNRIHCNPAMAGHIPYQDPHRRTETYTGPLNQGHTHKPKVARKKTYSR